MQPQKTASTARLVFHFFILVSVLSFALSFLQRGLGPTALLLTATSYTFALVSVGIGCILAIVEVFIAAKYLMSRYLFDQQQIRSIIRWYIVFRILFGVIALLFGLSFLSIFFLNDARSTIEFGAMFSSPIFLSAALSFILGLVSEYVAARTFLKPNTAVATPDSGQIAVASLPWYHSFLNWKYLLLLILISAGVGLYPMAKNVLPYWYSYYIKQELPVNQVANYINENTACDKYEKNTYAYGTCKLDQYSHSAIYKTDPIDCSEMYVYADDCKRLQTIQTAIAQNDSSMCSSLQGTNQFPICIGQFPQSSIWQSGCTAIMNKVLHESGNLANQLVEGRCLTKANANLTVPQSGLGRLFDSWAEYEVPYKEKWVALKRTNSIYQPLAPVWFNGWGTIDEKTAEYLKSINADPNNSDDFGRTALILFVDHLSYLVSGTIDQLPARQQTEVADRELQPLRTLIQFGVDPNREDILHLSAIDYASRLQNNILREKTLQIMQGNAAAQGNSSGDWSGWSRFDKSSYGFSLMYPNSLTPGSPEEDSEGTTWISFNERKEPLAKPFSIIISKASGPLDPSLKFPIYETCVKGKQRLVVFMNPEAKINATNITRDGVKLERLTESVDGGVGADFLMARSGDTCIVLEAMGPKFGQDSMSIADINKLFDSFVLK